MVSIKGLGKAKVLAALYNNSRPLGLGFLHFTPQDMTEEEAVTLLKEYTYFDYLKGRVMKIDLRHDDEFNEQLYDRDNGAGAAQRVVDALREESQA